MTERRPDQLEQRLQRIFEVCNIGLGVQLAIKAAVLIEKIKARGTTAA